MFRPTLPGARRLLAARRFASTQPPSGPRPTTTPQRAASGKPPTARRQFLRRVLLTGGITLVTVVGAITGARLKSDSEAGGSKQQQRPVADDAADAADAAAAALEMSLDERIATLEDRRARFVAARAPIEQKLAALRVRMQEAGREEEAKRRGESPAR